MLRRSIKGKALACVLAMLLLVAITVIGLLIKDVTHRGTSP